MLLGTIPMKNLQFYQKIAVFFLYFPIEKRNFDRNVMYKNIVTGKKYLIILKKGKHQTLLNFFILLPSVNETQFSYLIEWYCSFRLTLQMLMNS